MPEAPSLTVQLPGYPFTNLSSAATFAALREVVSTSLTNGQDITVDAGVTAADGLGGVFTWNSASTATDDGESVIKPADKTGLQAGRWVAAGGAFQQAGTGAVPRRMLAKARDLLAVTDFGANGVGANDRDAIQAALNASVGKYLIIPSGTYGMATNVNVPAGVLGILGFGGTIKMLGNASLVLNPNLTDLVIDGLVFDKNDTTNPVVWGFNVQRCRITNNRLLNCSASPGIVLRAYNDGTQDVSDNIVTGNFIDASGGSDDLSSNYAIAVDAEQVGSAVTTWNGAPGTLLTSTYRARNNVITNNEIIGAEYAIAIFFGDGNVIANNLIRDSGGGSAAPTGALRGISLQHGCQHNAVTGNVIINTQSSAIHLNYGSSYNLIASNRIHNEVIDYGNAAPGSAVNGSQALLQALVGCAYNLFQGNTASVGGSANAGPEFFFNVGPHSHGTRLIGNTFTGKAAKAVLNAESTYKSSGAPAGSYAAGGSFLPAQWANTDLVDVEFSDNFIAVTSAIPAIQVVQASTVGVERLVIARNRVVNTSHSYQLALYEETASDLANGYLVGNRFAQGSDASDFLLPRGRGHFAEWNGNAILDTQLQGSVTTDVASIASGSSATVTITVTGAALGDFLEGWAHSAALPAGVTVSAGTISATDEVVLTLENNTGGALNPASMTYYATVRKRLF